MLGTVTPLLKPRHFVGGALSMGNGGLSFDRLIGKDDRESELVADNCDELLERFAERAPSRCAINPRQPSAATLLVALKRQCNPKEQISIGYGLGPKYERSWTATRSDEWIEERQKLVVVCFVSGEVMGYAGLEVAVMRDTETKTLMLFFSVRLVYVVPKRRGKGFGIDLSIACAIVAQELLVACYRAVRSGWSIESSVSADYESKGGEVFVEQFVESLRFQTEMLAEYGTRKSITLTEPQLSAGY